MSARPPSNPESSIQAHPLSLFVEFILLLTCVVAVRSGGEEESGGVAGRLARKASKCYTEMELLILSLVWRRWRRVRERVW